MSEHEEQLQAVRVLHDGIGGGRQHGKGVAGVPKLYGIRMYVLSESLVDMYHMTTLCTVPSTLTFTLGQADFR